LESTMSVRLWRMGVTLTSRRASPR